MYVKDLRKTADEYNYDHYSHVCDDIDEKIQCVADDGGYTCRYNVTEYKEGTRIYLKNYYASNGFHTNIQTEPLYSRTNYFLFISWA